MIDYIQISMEDDSVELTDQLGQSVYLGQYKSYKGVTIIPFDEVISLVKEEDDYEETLSNKETEIENLQTEIDDLTEKNSLLQDAKDLAEDNAIQKQEELEATIEELESTIEELRQTIKELEDRYEETKEAKQNHVNRKTHLQKEENRTRKRR